MPGTTHDAHVFTRSLEVVNAEEYANSSSRQSVAGDLNVAVGAGDSTDPKFLGGVMGNVLGGALTKTKPYVGGVIGHLSIVSSASTYPVGGVLAGVGDGVNDTGAHGVVSYIDGDSASTIAGAAFKVKCNNSTPTSGFHFGLDLQDAAHDGYQAVDNAFYLSAPIRIVEDVCVIVNNGAPSNGTTGAAVTGPGSLCVDYANGKLYINTNTKASPTWTVVGSQT